MPLGVYERKLREHVCQNCGRKFTSRGQNAKWCDMPECVEARKAAHLKVMREWKRRADAVKRKAKKPPTPRVCKECGAHVGPNRHLCDECRARRERERKSPYQGGMRIRGGDGSGKWRDGRYSRHEHYNGERLRDSEVTAGASMPYLDPETTRVEFRR